jgi:hypothetical protein
MSSQLGVGCRVRLQGLSKAELNGASGKVIGERDAETGRWPVRLLGPPEAVKLHPDGVKVKEGVSMPKTSVHQLVLALMPATSPGHIPPPQCLVASNRFKPGKAARMR